MARVDDEEWTQQHICASAARSGLAVIECAGSRTSLSAGTADAGRSKNCVDGCRRWN